MDEAERALREQAATLEEKIERLLTTQSARRAQSTQRQTGDSAALHAQLIGVMSAASKASFDAGVDELDALIESDQELGA